MLYQFKKFVRNIYSRAPVKIIVPKFSPRRKFYLPQHMIYDISLILKNTVRKEKKSALNILFCMCMTPFGRSLVLYHVPKGRGNVHFVHGITKLPKWSWKIGKKDIFNVFTLFCFSDIENSLQIILENYLQTVPKSHSEHLNTSETFINTFLLLKMYIFWNY